MRDALANTAKISSNYPQTPITIAIMKAILAWPHNRGEVLGIIDGFLKRATAVDGVNLGLFAKGLDLMPDFGYPPVQFGGWGSAKASWYRTTASHNTIVVDGKPQAKGAGKTTLWADGEQIQCVRASAPALIGGQQYERTVVTIDLPGRDFYLVDIFRVVGGNDHAKFTHSHFGTISTEGLSLRHAEPYGYGTQMRSFQTDPDPKSGWCVDWEIEDRYGLLPEGAKVRLRYTDLTTGAQASVAEGWVTAGQYNTSVQAWIPRIMVRRRSKEAPLASTFVSVIEPYEDSSGIASIRRLPLHDADGGRYADPNVAVEIVLEDGGRDLLIAADVENPLGVEPTVANEDRFTQPHLSRATGRKLTCGLPPRILTYRRHPLPEQSAPGNDNRPQEHDKSSRGHCDEALHHTV